MHNFLMCWQNNDSEEKAIHFYFKQEGIVAYLDHDDVSNHRNQIQRYVNSLKSISENIQSQYIMEDYYIDVIKKQ